MTASESAHGHDYSFGVEVVLCSTMPFQQSRRRCAETLSGSPRSAVPHSLAMEPRLVTTPSDTKRTASVSPPEAEPAPVPAAAGYAQAVPALTPRLVAAMQQTAGNAAVARAIADQ